MQILMYICNGVLWSWKISLRRAASMNYCCIVEWREDTLIVIRYPCSENPGMSPKVRIFFSNINLL